MKISERLRSAIDELRARRLERRGDLVRGTEQFWEAITTLAQDLIPDPEREIPRDLFVMLAGVWALQAEKNLPHDPYGVLRHIRDRAWIGYADTPALVQAIQTELPRSQGIARMARYFEEIMGKRSTYLFLPAVSRIERHQANRLPPATLKLDAAYDEFGRTSVGSIAQQSFVLAPKYKREQSAFLLSLLAVTWGRGDRVMQGFDLLADAANELQLLYEQPATALKIIRIAALTNPAAARIVEMADEVSQVDRPLWLETLFIVQNWRAGVQHFEHAFEMKAGPLSELLALARQ